MVLVWLEEKDKNLKDMVLDTDFDARPKKVYSWSFLVPDSNKWP